jgi:DHA2 family multidrug resistance protein-like MFS transporter
VAIAVWGSLSVVGSALGPIVGGMLLEHFWWGSVFLVNIPVVVVALVAGVLVAPPNVADPAKRWDLVSSVQVMVGLVGVVVAVKEVAKVEPSWPVVVVAVLAAGGAFRVFARRQRRLPHPLLDFAIFRDAAFVSGILAAGISLFAISGIQLVTTQRFQLVAGFTPLEAGFLVVALAVGTLPTGLLGGAILHRVGLFPLIAGGLAVGLLGVVGTILALPVGLGWVVVGLVATGLGLGAAMSVASTAIIGNAPPHRAGMASSVEEVSYEFGNLTAVALLGSLLTAVYSATVRLPDGAPDVARESIAGALTAGGDRTAVVDAAATAFDTGHVVVLTVIAAVLAVGAGATGVLLRRRAPVPAGVDR